MNVETNTVVNHNWAWSSLPKVIGFHQDYPSGPLHGLHSLHDYLGQTSPPSSIDDSLKLWNNALGLIDCASALAEWVDVEYALHVPNYASLLSDYYSNGLSAVGLVHISVKEYLVLSSGESPYDSKWKMADVVQSNNKSQALTDTHRATKFACISYLSHGSSRSEWQDNLHHFTQERTFHREFEMLNLACILSQALLWSLKADSNLKLEELGRLAQSAIDVALQVLRLELSSIRRTSRSAYALSVVHDKAQSVKYALMNTLNPLRRSVAKSVGVHVVLPMLELDSSWKDIQRAKRKTLSLCRAHSTLSLPRPPVHYTLLDFLREFDEVFDSATSSMQGADGEGEETIDSQSIVDPMDLSTPSLLCESATTLSTESVRTIEAGQSTFLKKELKPHTSLDIGTSGQPSKLPYSIERFLHQRSEITTSEQAIRFLGDANSNTLHKLYLDRALHTLTEFDEVH